MFLSQMSEIRVSDVHGRTECLRLEHKRRVHSHSKILDRRDQMCPENVCIACVDRVKENV